jgi:hypothetical protein
VNSGYLSYRISDRIRQIEENTINDLLKND